MSVTVTFSCSGCDTEPQVRTIRRTFRSLSGRDHGVGQWLQPSVESLAPDGWVAFDPYTQCCYCADCWSAIEEPPPT